MQDKTEEIENIEWTVTGKVKKIERYAFSEKPDLEFDYDPMGQRITKTVYPGNLQNFLRKSLRIFVTI